MLVVEDDPFLREAIVAMIKTRYRGEVLSAENGRVALEILEHTSINIVLTDVVMPVMDGAEFLKSLQTRPFPPRIVVMSGGSSYTQNFLLSLGASAFLDKPFGPTQLFEALQIGKAKIA
jgi:two-component system sensor histidine kinase EvgS